MIDVVGRTRHIFRGSRFYRAVARRYVAYMVLSSTTTSFWRAVIIWCQHGAKEDQPLARARGFCLARRHVHIGDHDRERQITLARTARTRVDRASCPRDLVSVFGRGRRAAGAAVTTVESSRMPREDRETHATRLSTACRRRATAMLLLTAEGHHGHAYLVCTSSLKSQGELLEAQAGSGEAGEGVETAFCWGWVLVVVHRTGWWPSRPSWHH